MRLLVAILASCALSSAGQAQLYAPPGSCAEGACPTFDAWPGAGRADAPQAAGELQVDPRAIVRVTNSWGSARALGTGTLVEVDEDRGLIVTCAHLFRENVGTLSVGFADQRVFDAQLIKVDAIADLAALAIRPPATPPIEIAAEAPRPGDRLVSCGYGSDGRLWCNRGRAVGYVSVRDSSGAETLELTGAARFGDSGGPVLDDQHRLVAVLFGTNGQVVDGTFCGRVRRFVAGLSPRFRARKPSAPSKPAPLPAPASESPPLAEIPPTDTQPPARSGAGGVSVRPPTVELPPGVEPMGRAADALSTAVEPWISARLAAVLISIGVPGGIAGVAAGAAVWLVMRRGKKRLQAQIGRLKADRRNAPADRSSVDVGAPADPLVVERHHNRYVAFETTALDKAWAAAHAHVGEKYPGAVPYLKIAESVKDQLLAGNPDSQIF